MILLSIHPIFQFIAIFLAFYAAYLGLHRALALHFNKKVKFDRDKHAVFGSLALITMMGGIAAGVIMISRFLHKPILATLHGKIAMVALPFLLFSLFSGFFMYLNPKNRKILPILHGINNVVVLLFTIAQIITGIKMYSAYVLGG